MPYLFVEYPDAEHALDAAYAKKLGIDNSLTALCCTIVMHMLYTLGTTIDPPIRG